MSVINFNKAKEAIKQKEQCAEDRYWKEFQEEIEQSFRKGAFNRLDKFIKDYQNLHQDLKKLLNWRIEFSLKNGLPDWNDGGINQTFPSRSVMVALEDYEKYKFLEELVEKVSKNYDK